MNGHLGRTLWGFWAAIILCWFPLVDDGRPVRAASIYESSASGSLAIAGFRVGSAPLTARPSNLIISNAGTGVLSDLTDVTVGATADSFGQANLAAANANSLELGEGIQQGANAEGTAAFSGAIATSFAEFLTNGGIRLVNESVATTYTVDLELQYSYSASATVAAPSAESSEAGISIALILLSNANDPELSLFEKTDHLSGAIGPVAQTYALSIELTPGATESVSLFVDAFGVGSSAIPEPSTSWWCLLVAYSLVTRRARPRGTEIMAVRKSPR